MKSVEHYKINVGDVISNGKIALKVVEKNTKTFNAIIFYSVGGPEFEGETATYFYNMLNNGPHNEWIFLDKKGLIKLHLKR